MAVRHRRSGRLLNDADLSIRSTVAAVNCRSALQRATRRLGAPHRFKSRAAFKLAPAATLQKERQSLRFSPPPDPPIPHHGTQGKGRTSCSDKM